MLTKTTAIVVVANSAETRREHRQALLELERLRSERQLSHVVTRLYRGHVYGRKLARKLRAKRAAAYWGVQEWEVNESTYILDRSANRIGHRMSTHLVLIRQRRRVRLRCTMFFFRVLT